jgi:hypothetical protein
MREMDVQVRMTVLVFTIGRTGHGRALAKGACRLDAEAVLAARHAVDSLVCMQAAGSQHAAPACMMAAACQLQGLTRMEGARPTCVPVGDAPLGHDGARVVVVIGQAVVHCGPIVGVREVTLEARISDPPPLWGAEVVGVAQRVGGGGAGAAIHLAPVGPLGLAAGSCRGGWGEGQAFAATSSVAPPCVPMAFRWGSRTVTSCCGWSASGR